MSLPAGFSFKGRFNRSQFWRYWLGTLLGLVVLVLIAAVISRLGKVATVIGGVVYVVGLLCAAWISAATQVKRWHDRNQSGWMMLVIFIPVLGFFISLIFLGFLRGTPGPNRFDLLGASVEPPPVVPTEEAPPILAAPTPSRASPRWGRLVLMVSLGLMALMVVGSGLFYLVLPRVDWPVRRSWILAHLGSGAESHALAWHYRKGEGITQDFAKAAYWFERAANHGLPAAQFDLGGMYYYGLGVPADLNRARALLEEAYRGHYVPAGTLLGLLIAAEDPANPRAETLWQEAAGAGDPAAESLLGSLYLHRRDQGDDHAENLILALFWLETARRHQGETVPGLLQHVWATVPPENLEMVTTQVFGRLENASPAPIVVEVPPAPPVRPTAEAVAESQAALAGEVLAEVRASSDYSSLSTLYAEKSQGDPAWPATEEGQAVGHYLQTMRDDAQAVEVNEAEDGTKTLDFAIGGEAMTQEGVRIDNLVTDPAYRHEVVATLAQNIVAATKPDAVTEFLKKATAKGEEAK